MKRRWFANAHHCPGLHVHMEGQVDLQGVLTSPANAPAKLPQSYRAFLRARWEIR